MKSIEQIAQSFEQNENIRLSVTRSETLKKGQRKGNLTRNRTREINRIFKDKINEIKPI